MRTKTTHIADRVLSLLLSIVFLADFCAADLVRGAAWPPNGTPAADCQLDAAEELYYNGEFDQAITIIEDCLKNSTPDKSTMIRAHTILARIQLVRGDQIAAQENITFILNLDPSYAPSIEEETPKFVNLVAAVRKKEAAKQSASATADTDSSGISTWIWIGAGGALLGIIAILSSENNGIVPPPPGNQTLPAPPDFPDE